MPENPTKPQAPERRPGSQVAPGQKPLHRPGQTAATHSRVPIDQATAGKTYRVRDKDTGNGPPAVWGENLTYDEAVKCKERVVAQRRSKTARIEEMAPADWVPPEEPPLGMKPRTVDGGNQMFATPAAAPLDPVAQRRSDLRARRDALLAEIRVIDQELFPDLTKATANATAAAAPVARAAQRRHNAIKSAPPTPPPSPLTDDLLDGPGELPPDDEPTVGEVSDITADVGGGPSDDDKQRAKAAAEADYADSMVAAEGAYEAACVTDGGEWPRWNELGAFEHAAWRYFVIQGGDQPKLTKSARKVGPAMGVAP